MLYRKDYNKANRCPGWSGSGMNWTLPWEKKTGCEGSSSGFYKDDCNPWHVHQCKECGVKTLPYVTRFLDPDYWYHRADMALRYSDLAFDIRYRREERKRAKAKG